MALALLAQSIYYRVHKKYKFFSYSRNEKMQVALKRNFPDVEIILGAVEDKISIMNSIHKHKPDIVIHAAAMKHVDSAEKSPIGAIKSNVIGSINVIEGVLRPAFLMRLQLVLTKHARQITFTARRST